MKAVAGMWIDDGLHQERLERVARLFPGPDYYVVLRWIHEILQPANYVEIGVRRGTSLRLKLPDTVGIGIDPEPALDQEPPPGTRLFATRSDEFFQQHRLTEVIKAPSFALAFIDGLHLFEQALRDFINLERYAGSRSVILIHDCLPLDEASSGRTRTTRFYSGDVWKLAVCLREQRPDLRLAIVRTGPTGLGLVTGLDPHSVVLPNAYEALLARYTNLRFSFGKGQVPQEWPPAIENSLSAVRSWLAQALGGINPLL